MFTLTQYTSATSATGASLDQNLKLLGAVAPMPCTASGTNAITLTQQTAGSGAIATTIGITAYQSGMQFSTIAAQSNNGATTARVGALAPLPVYKPSSAGPVALSGGEIIASCAITLLYDLNLNGGNGGFHLISSLPEINGGTIAPALVRASTGVQFGATTNPTVTNVRSASTAVVFTAIVPQIAQEQTFTMAGVLATDFLAWAFRQPVSLGLVQSGYFIAGNGTIATMGVRMGNITAASTITPGTVSVGVAAFRTT